MVGNYLPLEQGLKHIGTLGPPKKKAGRKLPSIRTRIETPGADEDPPGLEGRKLPSIRTRIETRLRPGTPGRENVGNYLPLEQGLKQSSPGPAGPLPSSRKLPSIRTRIETE